MRDRISVRSAAAVLTLVAGASAPAAVISVHQFGPDTTSETGASYAPTSVAAGVVVSDVTDTGASITMTIETLSYSSPVLRVNPPSGNTTADLSFANNVYFQFILTPNAGTDLDLTSITLDAARGGAGTPRGFAVRSSADNFASVLLSNDIPTVRPALSPFTVDLSGPAFQNVSGPLTFRFYVYAPAAGSTTEYDNITVNGTATPVPEPAAAGLLAPAGLLLLRRRRGRAAAAQWSEPVPPRAVTR